jgi:tetratricopeptide (TPR) repeat protein
MSGSLEVDQGNLGTSLSNLERARDVDPRSYNVLFNLSLAYQYLGRSQDAIETAEALFVTAPANLQAASRLAVIYVSAGQVDKALAVPKRLLAQGVTPPALAAYFAGYNELAFMLDPQERAILFRLTPAAFDNDRAWWGQTLATAYWQQGDSVHARIYADSAVAPSLAQVLAAPKDPQPRGLYGLMLAYLGRAKEARTEFDHVLQPSSTSFTQYSYNLLNVAKGELALGDKEHALDHLEALIKRGHYVTPKWLLADPTFASLKGHPRFEQFVKGP